MIMSDNDFFDIVVGKGVLHHLDHETEDMYLLEISKGTNIYSLGYKTDQLIEVETLDYDERVCSYYLRFIVKDIPGVLAKITSTLNKEDISIEKILQLPENEDVNSNIEVPVIITTHETTSNLLNNAIKKIENLDFVISNIIISIDKDFI